MRSCITRLSALSPSDVDVFEEQCAQSLPARTAAAGVLEDALKRARITPAVLSARLPLSYAVINAVLNNCHRMTGFSTIQQSAVVDAFVALMCREVAMGAGSRLFTTLTAPVIAAVGALE